VVESFQQRLKRLRVTPRSFAFFSVISVFAPVFGDFDPLDSAVDVGSKVLLGVVATAILGAVLWPPLVVVLRVMHSSWRRFWLVIAVLVAGGALRGLVIHELGPVLSFDVATTVFQRMGNSVTTTVIWLVVLSLFTNATDDFRWRYSSLMRQLFAARAVTLSQAELSEVLGDVQADLRSLSVPEKDTPDQLRQMEAVAAALREDVLEKIRAHSRGLWVIKGVDPPALRVLPMLRLAVSRLEYSLPFVLVVYGLAGLGNLASWVSLGEAAARVSAALVAITVAHWVYQRLVVLKATTTPLVNVLYLYLLGVAVLFPMGFFEFFWNPSPWSIVLLLLLPLPTAMLPVIESTLNLAQMARDQLLAQISSLHHSSPAFPGPGARSSGELASYLHNSLQSEIQSIIVALEGASTHPNKVALGQASLERLRLLTARSLDEDFESFTQVPLTHLENVIEGWRGILEIEINWNVAECLKDDPRIATVVQIIQEVASNAVVHASATSLIVDIAQDRGDFVLRISNDAPRVSPMSQGLGTGWLESFLQPAPGSAKRNETTLEFRV
jgi:hypothetical protein